MKVTYHTPEFKVLETSLLLAARNAKADIERYSLRLDAIREERTARPWYLKLWDSDTPASFYIAQGDLYHATNSHRHIQNLLGALEYAQGTQALAFQLELRDVAIVSAYIPAEDTPV